MKQDRLHFTALCQQWEKTKEALVRENERCRAQGVEQEAERARLTKVRETLEGERADAVAMRKEAEGLMLEVRHMWERVKSWGGVCVCLFKL